MRWMRQVALGSVVFKVVVLGAWWWMAVAHADKAAAEKPAKAAEAAATPGGGALPADLLARSRGFRDLLEAVRQRGATLDEREQAVAAREGALKALEKTLSDQVARLEGLNKSVGAKVGAEGNVTVTKVYESMKAEEAAPILDRLDDATVRSIFGKMKEKQIGAILAAMKPDRAVTLTKAMAGTSAVH